jgi:hypothetical protein
MDLSMNNMFEGTIPTEVGQLSGLWSVSLANNDMGGEIPSEFGLLEKNEDFGYMDLVGQYI